MKFKLIFSLGILFAIVTALVLIQNGIYSISSDESSRTLIAYYWFSSGKLQSSSWLPLHFIILGAGFTLINDLIFLPRIISIIFGVLTIGSVVLLTEEIFKNRSVTVLSILIILLLPQRILLSIVPLPEIIFFFFISFGSLFLMKWLKTQSPSSLLAAALLISLSATLRYEGWLFTASLFIYVLFKKENILLKIFVLFLLSSFPLFWFILNYLRYENLFYFLNEPGTYYPLAQEENLKNTIIFNPFTQFIEQGLITLNILGLYGLYKLRKSISRKWIYIMFIPLAVFSITALTNKGLPAHNFWRTSAVWMILLVPYTAFTLHEVLKTFRLMKAGLILTLLFFAQLSNSNVYYIRSINKEICLTEKKMEVANDVQEYMTGTKSEGMILIENRSNYEHLDISVASSQPLRFVASERESLNPYRIYNKSILNINYYLLKSDKLKTKLFQDPSYRLILKSNGWILFGRKGLPD